MNTRFAWLSAVVAVAVAAVVSVTVPAVAAEPSAAPSREGTVVREPQDLRVEDMTDAESQQRLGEWEAGKRDDRDGYIILNQISFNHLRRKTTDTMAGQQAKKQQQELLAKHPEFSRLKDFRLSDKIQYQARLAEKRKAAEQSAKQWVPSDKTARRIIGNDRKAVVIYQFRLEFLHLPSEVEPRTFSCAQT